MQTRETIETTEVSNVYRNYVLVMLTLVYVFNFIDRQLLVTLQESIKKELNLSDTQLGLLSGFTFAIFYVTMGIPVARLADKGNRKNVVTVSLAIWSAMTALSGMAQNFIQMLLARIGVGIGEAGGSPPAHAMISDYFPPQKRSTALSIYSAGIYFGVLIGFSMGGYLNQYVGWRTAFFILGLPGVLFSLLFYFTVKEPRRGATDIQAAGVVESHTFGIVLKRLFGTKTFIYLAIGASLHVFCIYGLLNWAVSFLIRLHGMTKADAGSALGPVLGIGGAIGSFGGGLLTDYFGKKDKRLYLVIPAYAIILSLLFAAGGLFIPGNFAAIACIGLCASLQSMYLGPSLAVTHSLVPASMRSVASAIFFLAINLIGLGLGPLAVGFLSDALKAQLGDQSLRWAISCIIPVGLVAAVLFFVAAKKLVLDAKATG
ncbi:MAG TPA: MFS transporter [Chitinophagaceae bacterium]|nr:MFS transporter [Chitinophagaceae bacterium]